MVIAAFVVRRGVLPVGVIVGVRLVFMPVAILVMRERHALSAHDRGHALDGNGQGQQQQSKKPEERLRHQRDCSAVVLSAIRRPGSIRRISMVRMMRVDHRVTLAAADQPAVDGKRRDRRHSERERKTAPEQRAG
jgi:hypothetical protein